MKKPYTEKTAKFQHIRLILKKRCKVVEKTQVKLNFKSPSNNVFHFTEEFAVSRQNKNEKQKTRRPDIVLFINGIPFAVIELKKSNVETEQAISQMIRNQLKGEIPQLFKYTQITLVGNNHNPQYVTTGTAQKFYATWKEDLSDKLNTLISNRIATKLDNTKKLLKTLDIFLCFISYYNFCLL
jgi:type I restriction enzyme R subunit